MRKTVVDSPRGKFTLSAAGNPVQDIYLREVKGNNNEFRSIAVKALADPARGWPRAEAPALFEHSPNGHPMAH